MAKQALKPKKRWPKEKRLTDLVVALGPAKTAAQSVAALLRDFRKAHADGMAALEKQDFDALGDAIRRERDLIETQSRNDRTKHW